MTQKKGQHGGARQGAGRPPKYMKVAVKPAERDIESEKFLFMAALSDREPLQSLPIEMPCQNRNCPNLATQGVIQMVNRVWSIRPICPAHSQEQRKEVESILAD